MSDQLGRFLTVQQTLETLKERETELLEQKLSLEAELSQLREVLGEKSRQKRRLKVSQFFSIALNSIFEEILVILKSTWLKALILAGISVYVLLNATKVYGLENASRIAFCFALLALMFFFTLIASEQLKDRY